MDRRGIGIIGVGWPGQRHIEAYLKRDDVEIRAIADLNTDLAENMRAKYGLRAGIYADYRQMLDRSDIDAVSICTPNFLHAPMAIDALDADKHVLLEKPLAHTLTEGIRIAQRAAESDRVFMMAFNQRHRRDNRLLKEKIDNGELGDIYYAKTGWLRREWSSIVRGWFTTREQSGGGPLIDLGVHMLDLTLWFMGSPRPVSVTGSTYTRFSEVMQPKIGHVDVEDLAVGLIKLDNGGTVVLDASWLSFIEHGDYIYAHLFGSKGGAKLERYAGVEDLHIYTDQDGLPLVQSLAIGEQQRRREPLYMTYDSFAHEIAHFVDCIDSGTRPDAGIRDGLDILRVLDAIYRSAESGREVQLSGEPLSGEP